MPAKTEIENDPELAALEGEIIDWIQTNLEVSVTDLLTDLSDGVLLCRLLEKCGFHFKYRANAAKMGPFHCRDNICIFLKHCTENFELNRVLLFEPEDLLSHKNAKQVIICLLHAARSGVKFGLKPPTIIQYEIEIDLEQQQQQQQQQQHQQQQQDEQLDHALVSTQLQTTSSEELAVRCLALAAPEIIHFSVQTQESKDALLPPDVLVQSPSCSSSHSPVALESSSSSSSSPPPALSESDVTDTSTSSWYQPLELPKDFHDGITEVVDTMLQSNEQFENVTFERLGAGKYVFSDGQGRTNVIFCRTLRNVLMVRVGGGWSEFNTFMMGKFGHSVNCNLNDVYRISAERAKEDDAKKPQKAQQRTRVRLQNAKGEVRRRASMHTEDMKTDKAAAQLPAKIKAARSGSIATPVEHHHLSEQRPRARPKSFPAGTLRPIL